MLLLRRLLTIPVGVLFFVLLLLALVVVEVHDTFLDTGFYTEELRKADVYDFVLVNVLTSALDEAREVQVDGETGGLKDNPLVTSDLSTEDIVSSINRAVPPEWVQGLVEQVFEQLGRYLTGEHDHFAVTITAGDQVATMVSEVKSLLRKADAYSLLYEKVVDPAVEDSIAGELPLGVDITGERLLQAARRIVPPDWVQAQVEASLDEVTPYFLGDRDTFEVNVQLADRVGIALDEIKKILRESDAYELLYSGVVEPALLDTLGETVELPFGVTITRQEVASGLRQVAHPSWVQQQAEMVIDDAGPYITGEVDSFATEISLVDNKREAEAVIAALVDRKLADLITGLRQCRSDLDLQAALRELQAALRELQAALREAASGGLPSCRPPGVRVEDVAQRLGIDVAGQVQEFVLGPIPDRIRFTDTQLRSALSRAGAGDNINRLDDLRSILRDGWTYTHDDLRNHLRDWDSEDAVENLEDFRSFMADGWTFTEADFRDRISEDTAAGTDGEAIQQLDNSRRILKLARTFRWVVFVPLALLLVVLGFLGGRGWSGRVGWAAAFLLVSAATIYVVFSLVYDALAPTGFDEARKEAIERIDTNDDFANTARLVSDKVLDVAESVADSFVGSIAGSSLNLAVVGLVALAVAIFWSFIVGTVRGILPKNKG
jgi:hypothetical protein